MKRFTHEVFRKLSKDINKKNDKDFKTFIDALNNRFDVLFDSDIDDVIDYLSNEMHIENDAAVVKMTADEIAKLKCFINPIIEDLYDED